MVRKSKLKFNLQDQYIFNMFKVIVIIYFQIYILADDCFTTIEATSGHIFSPVYDEKKKILQCDWMIIVPDDYVTRLKFLTFDLPLMSNDRCLDGFILYGSYDSKNRRVNGHDMCGNDIPEVYVSISNRIWIYFQIINHAKSKFELIFDAVPVEKHGERTIKVHVNLILQRTYSKKLNIKKVLSNCRNVQFFEKKP